MPDLKTPFQLDSLPQKTTESIPKQVLGTEKIATEIKRIRLRTLKRVILSLLLIILGATVGNSWKSAFAASTITPTAIASTIGFIVFLPFVGLALSWYIMLLVNSTSVFFMVIPFLDSARISFLIILWLVFLTIVNFACFSARWRTNSFLSFSINSFGGTFSLLIIGFSLFFTMLYYVNTISAKTDKQFFISEKNIRVILKSGEGIIQKFFPGFSSNMSLGDYVNFILENQKKTILMELQKDPLYNTAQPNVRKQIEDQILSRARNNIIEELSKTQGRPPNLNQPISAFLEEYLHKKFSDLPQETKQIINLAWIFLVFLTVWSIGALMKPLIYVISWVFLQILLGINLFEIKREMAERKYLTLK